MKIRKSVLNKFTVEEIKEMGAKGARDIVKGYTHQIGHDMELLVPVSGERNVVLDFKGILCEMDGYDKSSKTASEIKSYHGSKVTALMRAVETMLLIYALQEITGCRKIKDFVVYGLNNKITKKYGLDYSKDAYSIEDYKNHKVIKVQGHIRNAKDMEYYRDLQYKLASNLVKKYKEVHNVA